jgi:hypothetical protein
MASRDVVERIDAWLEEDDAVDADQTLRDARREIISLRAVIAVLQEAKNQVYVSSAAHPDAH